MMVLGGGAVSDERGTPEVGVRLRQSVCPQLALALPQFETEGREAARVENRGLGTRFRALLRQSYCWFPIHPGAKFEFLMVGFGLLGLGLVFDGSGLVWAFGVWAWALRIKVWS